MVSKPEDTLDIFGWLADKSGCGTIRIMKPLDALASKYNLNTKYNEAITDAFPLSLVTGDPSGKAKEPLYMPKVIIGQRVCKNPPSWLWQKMSELSSRPKLVYELDDDLWNLDSSNRTAWEWFINGWDVKAGERHDVQENLCANIRVADRVTCSTSALAEIVSQWNDDVRVVPNMIPRWMTERERPRRDRLTIGWIGSATHHMDWAPVSNHIRRFLERNKQCDFKVIGAEYGDWLKIPKDQLIETGWFESVDDCWKAIDFDIGVAPLRPHVFNRSKSAIKFLEYAALGIPTVASDVGPYSDHIEHGKTGFLVKRDHEWSKYLRDLVNDEAMREEIGQNAREWAKQNTLEGNIDIWLKAVGEW